MTLNSSAFANALEATFASLPETAADAADALAQDYYDYASAAIFGSSTPTLAPALQAAFASTLLGAIAAPASGSPATFAAAWATAVAAFWVGVPVTGAQSGATVACPGASSLTVSLTIVFANLANTAATCAQALAAALHTATMTVTAAVAPPPGTVLPIS